MNGAGTVTGRTYTRTRPRGFADWTPQAKTAVLLDQVQAVLVEYRAHLPLSLRQVFYRLVGRHGYDKTERAYQRLGETVNKARRARLIPMGAIRDDGLTSRTPGGYDGVEDFRDVIRNAAATYRRDVSVTQPDRVELWIEAAGMVPQAFSVAAPYGVTVYSSGGFDSTTAKYSAAQRLANDGRQAVILHVGDHDPSGCAIIDSAAEDVTAFAVALGADEPEFHRVAITPDQVDRYNLPTAPQKRTDQRGEHMAETVQAEALPPDVLASEIDAAVRAVIDLDALADARDAEQSERARLVADVAELWGDR